MASLEELSKNLQNFRYYSGYGTFNANNLPYGKDRPGGGDSNQPFVVRGVDTRWSPSNFDDGLSPFGAVTLASRTASDLSRVTQFLYTTIKGPLFLLKQTGLQRSNPNINQIDVNTVDKRINPDLPTQLYNPLGLNTLAQVALGALGARFTKHGLIPQTKSERSYETYILSEETEGRNRLNNLVRKFSDKTKDQGVILKYGGGAQSFFGIGNTTINRVSEKSRLNYNNVVDENSGFISIPISNLYKITSTPSRDVPVDPTKIAEAEGELLNRPQLGPDDAPNTYSLQSNRDFRSYKNAVNRKLGGNSGNELPESNYDLYNMERRIGIARVRTPQERVNYSSEADTADRINAISLYYSNNPATAGSGQDQLLDVNDQVVDKDKIRDLIKFRIKIYDNDRNLNPKGSSYGVYIVFRSYINNIKRTVIPKLDAYKYVGRGESFYAYDGFTESVTISFTIAASSRAEMKPLYQKLNYLISSLTPDYSIYGLMRGNIAELTVGDFLLYQPGIITNFDMIIDEDSNWEIALQEPENERFGTDTDMHELPQLIKCSMTFIPIYNFLPRKNAEAPFIGIDGLRENKPKKQWLNGLNDKLKSKEKTAPKGSVTVPDPTPVYLSPNDPEFFNPTTNS